MNIFQVPQIVSWTCIFNGLARGFGAITSGPMHHVQSLPSTTCSLSPTEYNTLYIFYNATNGTHWVYDVFTSETKWSFPSNLSSPCEDNWQGVSCSPIDGCVVASLQLPNQNLQGTIPQEIANLHFLEHFEVSSNRLYGTIPTEMSNMTSLRELVLNNNKLTGPLPAAFGSLQLLESLDLNSNGGINGSIPTSWCALTNLRNFTAASNSITGQIPSCVGQWTILSVLNLEGNQLSGSIPSDVGNWTLVTQLYLSSSRFTNTLPTELAQLQRLSVLELQSNRINGTIPPGYCKLHNLNSLYLYSNLLTGTIPDCVQNMISLDDLKLSNNSLSSSIPAELLSHSALQYLELNNNWLSGTIPEKISVSLVSLNVNNNHLTSSIPSFGGCSNLIYLDLNSNLLAGKIPSSLGYLQFAYFQSNSLSGTLPEELISSTSLQYVSVYTNHLTGSIPDVFNSSFHLVEIDFGNNSFSHTIPPSLGQLSRLEYLYLDNNSFVGTLPRSIGACRRLQLLWVERNFLTGTIPSDVCNITALVQLSVFNNFLTGTLPCELGNLVRLNRLVVSNTYITGTISPFLSNMRSLAIFDLSSNALGGNLIELFPMGTEFENLTTIDFSNNQFTGMVPSSVFRMRSLIVLSLYSNCFMGSVPSTICDATNIQTLALDSLSTGSTCIRHLPPALSSVIKGVFPIHHLHGTIPECVWSLPYLNDLHLSGNGLRGTLGELPANSKISQISIAHNRLTGAIPMSMQRYGRFTSFDAMNNKLTGSLSSEFSANTSASISLTVNRLSGDLPQSIINVDSIDILSGNLFSCLQGELPKNDPASGKYVCGSDSLNDSAYTWIVIAATVAGGIILMMLLVMHCRSGQSIKKSNEIDLSRDESLLGVVNQIISLTVHWMKFDVSKHPTLRSTNRFLKLMTNANHTFVILVLCYLCGPLVSYCVLKLAPQYASKYSTHSAQYAWVTTAAYLHGSVPATLVLVYSFISGLYIAYSMLRNGSVPKISFRPKRSPEISWVETLRRHGIAVGLQLLNAVVLLTVNMGYVTTVILGRYSSSTLLLIQALMSLYKVAWSSIYIPWAISSMSFLAERHLFRHEVFMNLFNFIIAPSIATFFTDSNCLYYAIVGQEDITSSYQFTSTFDYCVGTVVDGTEKTVTHCSQIPFTHTVPISLNPPWFYSCQCGSELLVNYIPVLLYVYAIRGVILPFSKCIVVLMPSSATALFPRFLFEKFVGGTILFDSHTASSGSVHSERPTNRKRSLFRGGNVIVKLIVDFAILASFGLAAPILAVAIWFQVFTSMILWRLLIGRYVAGANPTDLSQEDSEVWQRLETATMPATKGTVVGMWLVIATCSIFWALLTYDMVADVYGAPPGRVTAALACILPTACFPLFVAFARYTRLISFNEALRPVSSRIFGLQLVQIVSGSGSMRPEDAEVAGVETQLESQLETTTDTPDSERNSNTLNSLSQPFDDGFSTGNPLR